MEFLSTPINVAGNWLFGKLKDQVLLIYHYNDNFNNLEKPIKDLGDKKTDIETQLEAAQRDLKLVNEEVKTWLEKVGRIQSNFIGLRRDEEARADKRCLIGLCPDLCSRLQLSEQAVRLLDEIKDLQEKGTFSSVAHDPPPPRVVPVQQDCVENLKSRNEITTQVMALLRDEKVKSIGVYGMGGIGKTTLVETVNNRLLLQGTDVFRTVIKLVVSKDPDTKMIQHGIAERLGLKLEDRSSEDIKADKLRQRLEDEKSVLIIFDDVWDVLDLARIGIPSRNHDVCCKLIITTRDRNVCTRMGIEQQIEIGLLPPEESMILFKKKAGDAAESPDLRSIAEDIVARCKGSPLAISTIGSSLKNGEEFDWKDALRALEYPNPSDLQEIMQPVIDSLKFSYDRLEGEGIKLCFLFCCLFPEGYNISVTKLRNYGVGEDFLKVDGTLEDAANKLRVYIKKLKDRGLLLEGDKEGHVKMHDVVRAVAVWIASKEEGFSVNVGKRSTDSCEIQNYKRVSFMNIENLKLSVPLDCPNLRTLMIRSKSESPIDEESSFERMTTLVILEMRINSWRCSVPKSLECLTNLQALFLVGCDLSSKISMIGRMKNLKILDLSYSEIGRLPEEIGNLSNLKCLNLTGATFLAVAPGVMSKLTDLEELHAHGLLGILDFMDLFDGWDNGVASLVNLSSLEIRLGHEVLESASFSFSWKNLKHFSVLINSRFRFPSFETDEDEIKNVLSLEEVNPTSNLIYKSLCNLTHKLKLERCHGFKDVADLVDLQVGGFKNLEYLEVRDSDSVEYLMSFEEESAKNCLKDSFQGLEELRIDGLVNMKKIVHGRLKFVNLPPLGTNSTSPCFQNLKYLTIRRCPKLESIFPFSIAQCLQQLIRLKIWNCRNLVYVIEKDEEEEGEGEGEKEEIALAVQHHPVPDPILVLLPSLKHLELKDLPSLEGIYQGNLQFNSPLESVEVGDCPNLRKLPLGPHTISTLQRIVVRESDSVEYLMSFEEESAKNCLQDSFQSLKKLEIDGLVNMKKIIHGRLKFVNLPPLGTNSTSPCFQNLNSLTIRRCPKLESIFPFSIAQCLQQLIRLEIADCPNLVYVIEKDEEEEGEGEKEEIALAVQHHPVPHGTNSTSPCFQNLEYLAIQECPKLESIFPFSIAQCLPQLIEIKIEDCPNLVYVIEKDEEEEGEGEKEEIALAVQHHPVPDPILVLLPSLKCLWFSRLLRLEGIYQGNLQFNSRLEFVSVNCCPNLRKLPLQSIGVQLEWCNGFKDVVGFKNLEYLDVSWSDSVEYLMSFEEESRNSLQDSFQRLKELKIDGLVNMKKIVHGRLKFVNLPPLGTNSTSPCFQNLNSLKIRRCPKLESLFSFSIAQCLQQLIQLDIDDCPNLVYVIEKDEEEEGEGEKEEIALAVQHHPVPDPILVLLPSLKHLRLKILPSLEGIYQGNLQFNSPLKSFEVRDCPNLRKLPLGPQAISTLQTIEGQLEWCHGFKDVGGFENLEYLDVIESDSVEYLMSFEEESRNCLQDSFQGLKGLGINGLVNMKKIIHGRLKFVNLPPLGTNSTSPCFQNLHFLTIRRCPKLESLFSFSIAQCLQHLIQLDIDDCPNLVYVIEKGEEEEGEGEGEKEEIALAVQHHPVPDPILVLLPSLKDVSFTDLPRLEGIYQGNMQFNSCRLKSIRLRACPNLRNF